MKILNWKDFIQTPKETVFSYYKDGSFSDLCIKTSDINEMSNDFLHDRILDAIEHDDTGEFFDKCSRMIDEGISVPMDFDFTGREGYYERDQLFAIYEEADVKLLIDRLQRTLK